MNTGQQVGLGVLAVGLILCLLWLGVGGVGSPVPLAWALVIVGMLLIGVGGMGFGYRTPVPGRQQPKYRRDRQRAERWRKKREGSILPVAALLITLVGMSAVLVLPHPVAPGTPVHLRAASLSATSSIQQTSTAQVTYQRAQIFYQNGSATYNDGSTTASFPATLGVSGTVTVSLFSATIAVLIGSLSPRLNITQNGVLLANASDPYTLVLTNPVVGANPIKEKIVAAYTPAGATPSAATYTGTANCTEAITFTKATAATWAVNQGNYSLNYTMTAPAGISLNSTTIYLPFPANASVNYTSVKVYLGGALVPQVQVALGGVYVLINGLAGGGSDVFAVSFRQPPATTGPAPYLPVRYYYTWSGTQYAFNVSWINLSPIPYAGQYVIQVQGFPYPINPVSLTVTANGKAIANGSYQMIGGNTLDILPGVVTVYTGSLEVFLVKFYFLGIPPALSFADTSTAFVLGNTTVTWGELIVLGIGIVVFYAMVEYAALLLGNPARVARYGFVPKMAAEQRRTFAALFVFLLVLFVALYIGTLHA